MKRLIHNIRIKLGLYDLRKEGAKWVANQDAPRQLLKVVTRTIPGIARAVMNMTSV